MIRYNGGCGRLAIIYLLDQVVCKHQLMPEVQLPSPKWFKLTLQLLAGSFAGFLVSPSNAILDKSVIEYANGKSTLKRGVRDGFTKLFKHPITFFTSFKFSWMFFVYSMTYSFSNFADHLAPVAPQVSPAVQKLAIVFCINTTCGILKDKAYIQRFGTFLPKTFPVSALVLLFCRDLVTMASAFTFPSIIGQRIADKTGKSLRTGTNIAQVLSPVLIQIVVTPLHLLGLDIYNRSNEKLLNRLQNIKKLYLSALGMRMVRFLPALGFGGVANTQMRALLKRFQH